MALRKGIVIFGLLCLLISAADANNKHAEADSLNAKAKMLLKKDFKESIRLGSEALKLSEKQNYPKGKLEALSNIALANYYLSQYERARSYFKRIFDEAGEGFEKHKADALKNIGSIDAILGKYGEALNSMLMARSIYAELKDDRGMLSILNNTGNVLLKLGNYQKAHEYYIEGLQISKKTSDKRATALLYNNVGNVYNLMKQYEKALEFYKRSFELKKDSGNKFDLANAYNNIGLMYSKMKRMAEGITHLNQALRIRREIGDDTGVSESMNNLGEIYYKQADFNRAESIFLESHRIKNKIGRKWSIGYTKQWLGKLYLKTGKLNSAQRYLKDGLEISKKIDAKSLEMDFYRLLYLLEKGKKNYQKAADYLESHYKTKEIIDRKNSKDRLLEIEASYRFEEKEKELAKNKRELKKQDTIKNLLIMTTALVIIISLLIYNRYRFNLKIQRRMEQKNAQLTKAYSEIELMSRTDHLTSISNRRDIIQRIQTEKDRLQRNRHPFTLVMIDIDNFKSINDRFGHNSGDFVLKSFADILKTNVRKQDAVSRWGGEEFLLVLPETLSEGALKMAEKIRKIVEESTFEYKGNFMKVTITLGVGTIEDHTLNMNELIHRVDEAVYKGKKSGKNRVVAI